MWAAVRNSKDHRTGDLARTPSIMPADSVRGVLGTPYEDKQSSTRGFTALPTPGVPAAHR